MSIDEVIENALFDYCKARCERESATQDRVECDLRATIEMYVAEAVARERDECALIADKWATDEQRKFGNGGPAAAIRARAEKDVP